MWEPASDQWGVESLARNERAWKHVEIREHVRGLVQGAPPGSPAPSERELVEKFGVARMTVRQAIESLVSEGLLERVPGRGTFVADPRRAPTGVLGFAEELALQHTSVGSRTVWLRRAPLTPALTSAFALVPGDAVWHWRRLRLVEDQPACVADTWLPESVAPGLVEDPPDSLYAHLAARGRRPDRAEDSVTARPATTEESELLGLAGEPVLCRQRRASCGDLVVEVTREVRRFDAPPLRLRLGQGGVRPL